MTPQVAKLGDAALVTVQGLIDEHFPGFGDLSGVRTAVIDLANVSFMTSFGVRQWLKAMGAVPDTVQHLYLTNCPTIVVDQLNMILNFGGRAKVVSLIAPFVCTKCGQATREAVDVLVEGPTIAKGELAPRSCAKCQGALELDDNIDSYFVCLKKYAATSIEPTAADLLAKRTTLQTAPVKPSIRTATAPVVEVQAAKPAVVVGSRHSLRTLLPTFVVIVVLLAIVIGMFLLVGPS